MPATTSSAAVHADHIEPSQVDDATATSPDIWAGTEDLNSQLVPQAPELQDISSPTGIHSNAELLRSSALQPEALGDHQHHDLPTESQLMTEAELSPSPKETDLTNKALESRERDVPEGAHMEDLTPADPLDQQLPSGFDSEVPSTVADLEDISGALSSERDISHVIPQVPEDEYTRPHAEDKSRTPSVGGEEEHDLADEARYEYQGDATQADLAVDEAPTMGLLDNAAVETDTVPQESSADLVEADHWGQTEDLLGESDDKTINQSGGPVFSEWDNLDDGTDFDAVLGTSQPAGSNMPQVETQLSHVDKLEKEKIQDAGNNDNGEIEDLWAAALGDDDLLDESSAVDPSGFFDEDDDGSFLDDPQATIVPEQPTSASQTSPATSLGARSFQAQQHPYQPISNAPYQQLHHSVDPRPASTPTTFLPEASAPGFGFQPSLSASAPRPAPPKPTGSFVDKSKSGYASPYDLPTDIVATRRRPAAAPSAPSQMAPPPPPRSSSMQSAVAPISPSGPPRAPSALSATSPTQYAGLVPSAQKPPLTSKPSSASGFFADLPMTSKPKTQRPDYTPTNSTQSLPSGPVQRQPSSGALRSPPEPAIHTFGGLLHQPENLPLYPDQHPVDPALPRQHPAPPPAASRYSPAPNTQQIHAPSGPRFSPAPAAPPSQARYAAAPNPPTTAAQRAHAFVPRTSSPLAYHEMNESQSARAGGATNGSHDQVQPSLETMERSMTPPAALFKTTSLQSSPRSVSRYAPTGSSVPETISPPARPQTQSPMHAKKPPTSHQPSGERRKSAVGTTQHPYPTATSSQSQLALPHRQRFSADLNFEIPQDERAGDPLERWRGHPIFHWSPSGTIVSSFPKQSPFYAAGHAIPVVRCSAGDVVVHDTKATFPLTDTNDAFPGPLQGKAKSKKKDALNWMTTRIASLETAVDGSLLDLRMPEKMKTRADEKVILWKVMKLLVEHDNAIDGKPEITSSIRKLLVPDDIDAQSPLGTSTDAERLGSGPDQSEPAALGQIRKLLLEGQRERAVWFATENKMWSHAMLIGSTMGPDLWKQLAHEFVKSQVQSSSDSTRSLAALYEVFGSNWEESVDEIVPPFARAGISITTSSGPISATGSSGVEGLEKWRETLSLILSNRSTNDVQAIAALGRLLASYGRVEAAHVCYIFAGSAVRHGGLDDKETSFVLLGADHKDTSVALGSDLDSILLTEVYEYLQSLSPQPGHAPVIPHLQSYKLVHAYELAQHGYRTQAQAYCDSIFNAMKLSTKAAPYYHVAFISALEDFNRCLSQAPPTGGSSGLLSRIAPDKVSGSMWKRFNSFVAGEDDDGASTTSGGGDNADGPFGKVSGNSPVISRATSSADLYGAMSTGASVNGIGASPISPHTPYMPSHAQSVPASLDRSVSGRDGGEELRSRESAPPSGYEDPAYQSHAQPGYMGPVAEYGMFEADSETAKYGYEPPAAHYESEIASHMPPEARYDPSTGDDASHEHQPHSEASREAQATSGYTPYESSYQPYQPDFNNDEEPEDDAVPKPKKKSFMDLSDDESTPVKSAAASKASQKAEADRAADEAFRKAAEADAEKDKAAKELAAKKGWFGGWFGKKDSDAPQAIKAKLGEESSFYFDKELGKWVNKKGGQEEAKAAPTPPPRRGGPGPATAMGTGATPMRGPPMSGPPSRVPSASASPAVGPPSRPGTAGPPGAASNGMATPPMPSGAGRAGTPGGLEPPSRPGTGLSNASSIDDLLGAPGAKKGTIKGKKRGGRYVDVMAK
ncbi:hypothetical protein ANO11243_016030 [Dothideomycetidae sp. 11243]|nr:hypothetical protein ANO11243_016030 [fungal sp. No.11243]